MLRRLGRLRRGLCAAGCLGWFSLAPAAGAGTHLSGWADFDALVAAEYGALSASAPCYPPGGIRFGISHPPVSFDPAAFAALTNASPPRTLAGVPAWPLRIVETQSASRVWIATAGGLPVRTSAVPAYDPEAWSRAAYGDPPGWLSGADLERWYRERARDRIELGLTLIPAERFDEYLENLRSAATNGPAGPAAPVPPADTSRVAFALVAPSDPGRFGFTLYTPGDLPVDIFTRTNPAAGPLWNYAGTVQATAPFTPAAVAAPHAALFLLSARGDIDTDGDGIPDGMEMLHFGTDPLLWDTSGGGLSDWVKIYRYGLDPLLRDSDGDGCPDDEELLAGTDPAQATPGAASGAIRYYRDADDRVTAVYTGMDGGAATAAPTPAGNPAALQERSAP
ncbi:MAG: hypothetical protein ACOX5G_00435 [Kiritimatiellia bacterium]